MIDRALGCLIGSAVGDALGMPASFMTPATIRRVYGRIDDFLDPGSGQIVHQHLTAGEVTDDTEESLLIAAVLVEAGRFDEPLFVEKMRRWAVEKRMLESTVIGPSTRRFLTAICAGADYRDAGRTSDTNGSAMRVSPVGIFHHGDVAAATADAIASSLPSHGSRTAVAAAAAVAAAVSVCVEGGASPGDVLAAGRDASIIGAAAGFDSPAPSIAARLDLARDIVDRHRGLPLEEVCVQLYDHIGASMKCYESVPFSLGVFYAANGDFETGLLAAVNIGDDADTNGAIVGSLCGAYTGINGVRPSWADRIRSSTGVAFEDLARRLLRLPV